MAAGLEIEIECGAAGFLSGVSDGLDFGVGQSGAAVASAPDDFFIVHEDGPDHGVG